MDGFWTRRFNRDPGVLGRTIRFGKDSFEIIGVTQPRFFGIEVGTMCVIWKIEMEAESAVAAAKKALDVQRDPKSLAALFEVTEWPSRDMQSGRSAPRIAVDLAEVA